MNDKILSLVSLATKARKTLCGEPLVESGLKEGKVWLTIVATDASLRTTRRITGISQSHDVKYLVYSTKELLGRFTGHENIAVCGICDKGFADAILKSSDTNS